MHWIELSYLLPLIIIVSGAVVLMLLSPVEHFSMERFSLFTFLILLVALSADLYYFGDLFTTFPLQNIFSKMLIADSYSVYFDALILSGALVTSLIGTHYFQAKRHFKKEFFSLFLFYSFYYNGSAEGHEYTILYRLSDNYLH